ncbi:Uncharacterised protein [Vibrio cholerae]|nr:Uncharacterised protein [Vibrio cholerae]
MQVSSPISFTPRIISLSSGISRSFGFFHAAPIQKRVEPEFLAFCAASNTRSTSIKRSLSTSVR